MKIFGVTFLKKKMIVLGEQAVTEHTILEWKKLFSIKLFHFHKTSGSQDRFHTHAFNAVSFRIHGNYVEEIIRDGQVLKFDRNRSRFIYIPRDEYHRITRSDDCRTLLITGPWGSEFKELRSLGESRYQEVTCGAGRVDVRMGGLVVISDQHRREN